jgi:hypothetical protein
LSPSIPGEGGNFRIPLQYLPGLRAPGIEAYWLEIPWGDGDTAARDRVATNS